MNIREITIGDLNDFIHSEEYLKLNPKPITPLRAVSQSKNPAARPEDVALFFAADNENLLAFSGILPDKVQGIQEPVYSNTGWWIHPELGRKYGLQVFLKAFKSCRRRMFLTDCSEHTQTILEKTGLFIFPPPFTGTRFFIRFYSGDILRRKGKNIAVSKIFSAVDSFLNVFVFVRLSVWRMKNFQQDIKIHTSDKISSEMNNFIEQHSEGNYLKQYAGKLNWIIQNPWLSEKKDVPDLNYPFSYKTEIFNQNFLTVQNNGETVALLFLSNRNNQVSIPYVYFIKGFLNETAKALLIYLISLKVDSVMIFQPELLEAFTKVRVPHLFRAKIKRYYGYSKELDSIFSKEKKFQDGDGDVAFS